MNEEMLKNEWNAICEKVVSYPNINSSQVKAFFLRLQIQAMSDDFIMLTADNDFIKTWIEKHYSEYIKKALYDLHGVDFTIAIEVDTNQTVPEQAVTQPANDGALSSQKSPAFQVNEESQKATAAANQQEAHAVERREGAAPTQFDSMNSKLTFENFVVGTSNNMAYSMALAVAEQPGKISNLNPLFIYGKSGLGKTHLLMAIKNYIEENMPDQLVIYADSAELVQEFTDAAIVHDTNKESYRNFQNKYRQADVLLIDDIQYLQGKTQTLDMVFHFFNKMVSAGKQVVLSADRAPKNIDIDERYQSRFNSGGTFDIQPPEVETKLGIIKGFVGEYRITSGVTDFDIPFEIEMYVAENSSSNVRELKSAITKIIYQMNINGEKEITLAEVRALLEDHFSGGTMKKLSIADIQKQVEAYYKISHAELIGKKRSRNIAYARQVAIYLCRLMLDLPFKYIGDQFGGKDHSTVMYSVTIIEEKMKENREMREEIESIKQMIRDM